MVRNNLGVPNKSLIKGKIVSNTIKRKTAIKSQRIANNHFFLHQSFLSKNYFGLNN